MVWEWFCQTLVFETLEIIITKLITIITTIKYITTTIKVIIIIIIINSKHTVRTHPLLPAPLPPPRPPQHTHPRSPHSSISFPVWTVRLSSFKLYHDYEKRLLLNIKFYSLENNSSFSSSGVFSILKFWKVIGLLIFSVAPHQNIPV